jgi:hypothetical protein
MKTLWRDSALLPVNLSSGSIWFHLPPARNGLAGRGQVCVILPSAPSRAALASRFFAFTRKFLTRFLSVPLNGE